MPFGIITHHLAPHIPKGAIVAASTYMGALLVNVTNSTDPIVIAKNVTLTVALASYPVTPSGTCRIAMMGSCCYLRHLVPTEITTATSIKFMAQIIRSYYP
jgi:hypothetical protein